VFFIINKTAKQFLGVTNEIIHFGRGNLENNAKLCVISQYCCVVALLVMTKKDD
jgi:hypothetical protein